MVALRQRCNHCKRMRAARFFSSAKSAQCRDCRKRHKGWEKLSLEERALRVIESARRVEPDTNYRVSFVRRSLNKKLGGIPSTMTDRGTCPPSCTFYEAGCYATYGKLGHHWRETANKGISWREFLGLVVQLPSGQLWRHATAGDLPGYGNRVNVEALNDLAHASRHTRGFTFTHKPLDRLDERLAVVASNHLGGFTINLSADDLEHADERYDLSIGPVAVVLPHDAPTSLRTPKGRRVVVCPAQTTADMTCAKCRLCANADRVSIVGFRAHGQAEKLIPEIVRARRATKTTTTNEMERR